MNCIFFILFLFLFLTFFYFFIYLYFLFYYYYYYYYCFLLLQPFKNFKIYLVLLNFYSLYFLFLFSHYVILFFFSAPTTLAVLASLVRRSSSISTSTWSSPPFDIVTWISDHMVKLVAKEVMKALNVLFIEIKSSHGCKNPDGQGTAKSSSHGRKFTHVPLSKVVDHLSGNSTVFKGQHDAL